MNRRSLVRFVFVVLVAIGTGGIWLKAQPTPSTAVLEVVHSFAGCAPTGCQDGNDGSYPVGALIRSSGGVVYGTTGFTPVAGLGTGTIFAVSPTGGYSKIFTFDPFSSPTFARDGCFPLGRLHEAGGLLFGVTQSCGLYGDGTLFRVSPSGSFAKLHDFTDGIAANNGLPVASLTTGIDGLLYGITKDGGANGLGSVFRLETDGTVTTVHSFSGTDGQWPTGELARAADGSIYGTTLQGGGSDSCSSAFGFCGTVFKISAGGTFDVVHAFPSTANPGVSPVSGVVEGADGNLYGLAGNVAFRLAPDTTYTVLHIFDPLTEGSVSQGLLMQATDGYFYGVRTEDGPTDKGGVFRMSATGDVTMLHSFIGPEGARPFGGLAQGADGHLYGTTYEGGADNKGVVFRIKLLAAANGTLAVVEDTPATGTLVATEPTGAPLVFSVVSNGTLGAAAITNAATGAYTYTPNPNVTGTDSFTFTANNGAADSNVATVTVTVTPVNDAPVASDGALSADAGVLSTGSLLATDVDSVSLTYRIGTNGSKGTAVVTDASTGAFTYLAGAGAAGSDTFTFVASDGALDSNVATVTVAITSANHPPVALAGSLATNEDTAATSGLSATDADGNALTFSIVTNGTKGSAAITNPATGAYTYTPNLNANGADSFTFKVNDGTVDSNVATVTVAVAPVNDLPLAQAGSLATNEDTPAASGLTATDADGDPLTFSIVTNGTKGTAAITNLATGTYTHTPNLNENGSDSFTFKVNDGTVDSNVATVSIAITAVNDAPVAGNGILSAALNSPVSGTLSATDVDSAALTFSIVANGTRGTAAITNSLTGSFTYTPSLNAIGPDGFTFKANDGSLDSSVATVAISITGANVSPLFQGQLQPSVGVTRSSSVVVGDFNRDGYADLAIATENLTPDNQSHTVAVLLGLGDGGFQAKVNYAVGLSPKSLAVADFNRDGIQDLAVANQDASSQNVSLLLGRGDGSFQAAVNYPGGNGPRSLAVGDFNRDGTPDLAIANFDSNGIGLLIGNGDGTFAAGTTYAAGSPYSVAVGDFNGDGLADIATTNYFGNAVSVLIGQGTGLFSTAIDTPVSVNPLYVSAGDFNGDGKTDLAVTSYGANILNVQAIGRLEVLLGDGNGSFQAPVAYAVGDGPRSVAVGDFNGDGKADLAIADQFGNQVSVLSGSGNGSFSAAGGYTVGGDPLSVAAGDFNGDGRPDLAVGNFSSNDVSVLLGTLGAKAATTTAVSTAPNPSIAGQAVILTAVVSSVAGIASGVVTFIDGTTPLGTAAAVGGVATFTTSALAAAAHPITALFGGDSLFLSSTSPVLTQDVQSVTAAPAITSANAVTFTVGSGGTFTVTTSGLPPATTIVETGALPSGVTFTSNGNGTATLSGTPVTGGSYPFTIIASNGALPDAQQSFTLTVNRAGQTITVTQSAPASAVVNTSFTVAATATSGLAVSYSSGSVSVCTNLGATFTMVSGTGTCVVQFNQAGNSNYVAAPQVTNQTAAIPSTLSLSVNATSVTEGNSGTKAANLSITRTGGTGAVTFAWVIAGGGAADGTATLADADYVPSSGTFVFPAGGANTRNFSIPGVILGDTNFEANETFRVAISRPDGGPIGTASNTVTITNDDALPAVSLNAVAPQSEGTTPYAFAATLNRSSYQTVTVEIGAVPSGTLAASSLADFAATSTVLTFPPGTTTALFNVAIIDDTVRENNETFTVTLASPTNATLGTASRVATITDNDPLPMLSINDVAVTEADAAGVNAVFTVTLSPASGQTVTIRASIVAGTATGSNDYTNPGIQTLTFLAGETTKTYTVPVIGDNRNEPTESFTVNLTGGNRNATVLDGSGLAAIMDNDPLPSVSIDDVTGSAAAGATTFSFTVSLSAPSGLTVTLVAATSNGTAIAPSDFAARGPLTLTFTPGQTTKTFAVSVRTNTVGETTETFSVNLSGAVNGTIMKTIGVGTVTN